MLRISIDSSVKNPATYEIFRLSGDISQQLIRAVEDAITQLGKTGEIIEAIKFTPSTPSDDSMLVTAKLVLVVNSDKFVVEFSHFCNKNNAHDLFEELIIKYVLCAISTRIEITKLLEASLNQLILNVNEKVEAVRKMMICKKCGNMMMLREYLLECPNCKETSVI